MIFAKTNRFNEEKGKLYQDFYEFIRLRNLLSKGASAENLNEWFAATGKSKSESARIRKSMSSIKPSGFSTDELNHTIDSPTKQKGRISVANANVRQNVPYYHPEQIPGPGAYNHNSSLVKPTFNRKGDAPPHKTDRKGILSKNSKQNNMSLEEFELTHNIVNNNFQTVNDGAYLNHKQTFRTRSAPSTGRPTGTIPISKPKYNPIIDLDSCPSDAIIGRWSSVHMESYKWNKLDKHQKKNSGV